MRKTPWMNQAAAAAAATDSLFRSLVRAAFRGRAHMAMAMAFVATLGAVTAYRTKGWTRWRPSDGSDPGLVGGYATEDKARGALLFSYFSPQVAGGVPNEEERKFVQATVDFLGKHRIVRGSSTLADAGCNQYWDNWGALHFQYVFEGDPPTAVLAKSMGAFRRGGARWPGLAAPGRSNCATTGR